MKKILILTARYGYGHIAIAKKLRSHLETIEGIGTIDTVDSAVFLNTHFTNKGQPFYKLRYAFHKMIHNSYQMFSDLPNALKHLHIPNTCQRLFKKTWIFLWGCIENCIYNDHITDALVNLTNQYDVIFSTVTHVNKLIWRNHDRYTTVNLNQDFGLGIKPIWWGQFWDYHLTNDSCNTAKAYQTHPKTTRIKNMGPIYHINDYISLPTPPEDSSKILFIPGKTGKNKSALNQLEKALHKCLHNNFQCVWKLDDEHAKRLLENLPEDKKHLLTLEPYGPLVGLQDYDLIVGKGGFNQISESLLQGTPYACTYFLGYWEKQNMAIATQDNAQVIDWSKNIPTPIKEQLKAMKKIQTNQRDVFFKSPDKWKAALTEIINTPQKPHGPVVHKQLHYDFSGRKFTPHSKLNTWVKIKTGCKMLLIKPIFYTIALLMALGCYLNKKSKYDF
jgi:hypothetical protein